MWGRLVLLGVVAACYGPQAPAGAACDPALDNCPTGQVCLLAGTDHRCVDPADPPDAGDTPDAAAASDAAADAPDVLPIDAPPPWDLVQTMAGPGGELTMAPTLEGSLIVVALETRTSPILHLTDDVDNVYVRVPDGFASDMQIDRGIELWYVADASPGATSIRAFGQSVLATAMWEVAGLAASDPLVAVDTKSNQPPTQFVKTPDVTTTAAGQFVVTVAIVQNTIAGTIFPSTFTLDHQTLGNGWAHMNDRAAPADSYQAELSQPTAGRFCAVIAAFR